jgi:site-specific DNA-cytosine methylase
MRQGMTDVLLGGPPCVSFSLAGKGKGEHDERDGWPEFCEAVELVRPRMFLGENVAGMLTERHIQYFGRTYGRLEAAGYIVQWRLLDSVNFGVPQFRARVWVWGIRKDLYAAGVRHCWPQPTHAWPPPGECMFGAALLPGVTVGQALGLDGWIHRGQRGSGITERHGDRPPCPTCEPAPCVANGENGSSRLFLGIRRAAGPNSQQAKYGHTYGPNEPAPTVNAMGKGGSDGLEAVVRVIGGGSNPHFKGEERSDRDITNEPSVTIPCGDRFGIVLPVVAYRWTDAMLEKHPPADPDAPSPTVQAKWFKGGAEGLLAVTKWKRKGELWVRRLSSLECLRLQSGPDDFAWPEGITKTAAYRVVGNGWACRMGAVFADAFAAADPDARTVASLFCGGGLGDVGWHGRFWSYEPAGREAVSA